MNNETDVGARPRTFAIPERSPEPRIRFTHLVAQGVMNAVALVMVFFFKRHA